MSDGRVVRVAGPLVVATGLTQARLYDAVRVGPARLLGEVIRLDGDRAVIQVYEVTDGLVVGDPVHDEGGPLHAELGPGLLAGVFDGTQRPLLTLARSGALLERGADLPALDREAVWTFRPSVAEGDVVSVGDVLGTIQETRALVHRVLVPPGRGGVVDHIASGQVRVEDVVATVGGETVRVLRRWPVRERRPARRLDPVEPLVTGQRVIDTLFPIARGGTATIPGGFGTGKTVMEQALARYAEVDVVIYVACGERGNELTEVIEAFQEAVDPRTGAPLMERTILIANTSDMPIAAREASIYTGITLAEYYRDQGYDVALMADSTSRWAEALREVSSRLEELPGEEGYPAYLPARLAEVYERAGRVAVGEREGSVTLIGAVSPPGGDFSEPMTQHSLRLASTFWALDTDLARRRHYPAIHWIRSYTLSDLQPALCRRVDEGWESTRAWAMNLLGAEAELEAIVQLLGAEALEAEQRLTLASARRIREDFLQQSALDPDDAFCAPTKQFAMLSVLRHLHDRLRRAAERGVPADELEVPDLSDAAARMRAWPADTAQAEAAALVERIEAEVSALEDAWS